MIRPILVLGLLGTLAAACKDEVRQFQFDARLVNGENGNPAAGTDASTLRIGIDEGDFPPRTFEYPIEDGVFDAALELASVSLVTRVRVAIEGPTTELLAAPPAFVPASSEGFLRMVAAKASSCERVSFDRMEAPRAFFGMVQSGTFALLVGGTASSQEPQVEFFDALQWDSRTFSEEISLSELGETRAASIGEAEILVVPTDAGPFIFDMADPSRRVTAVVLHLGAGPASALVSVPGVGAMVIGGEVAGEAQSAVSLVAPGGAVTSLQLSQPRSGPGATVFGADVLIVGGDPEGNAEVLRDGSTTGQPVASVMDGVRDGGFLVGDGQSRALWMGGTDDGGSLREDTVRFDGCPGNCASQAGPEWSTARAQTLQLPESSLIIGGESSRLVEEVRWADENVEIQPLLELDVPRAGPGGILLESGAFVVAGGQDGTTIRDDLEFCVPAELSPL